MKLYRAPFMMLAFLSLLAGLWGGVVRLNVHIPMITSTLFLLHGPLMVCGFLGTLISLERAVALGYFWTYIAPILSGLGALALAFGVEPYYCQLAITFSSLILVIIFVIVFRIQPSLPSAIMWLGAFSWFMGNFLWLNGRPIPSTVHWWGGFLVLTIAGERLELARLQRLSFAKVALFLISILFLAAGLITTIFNLDIGVRTIGAGYLVMTAWLFTNDIARHTVKQSGLTRFIALCLLSGYVWLGVSAVLAILSGGVESGARYGAILHSLFLGFVFSMIFGHAPIIFPAVLGVNMTFRKTFYIHLVLLHLTLLIRIAGDLTISTPLRQIGGVANVLAILVFFANTIYSVLKSSPKGDGG